MTFQTGANVLAAIKAEVTTGVAATATGATRIRFIGTQGLELKTTPITSQEKTTAALTPMGRLGSKMVDGSYDSEISTGGHMTYWTEGIMRAAYVTSAVIGFGTMTTVALGTNTVTAAAGDWIATQGLRVGDIFTVTGTTTSANNNLRTPITAIGTLTLTVPAGTFVTLAATATGTITRLRKVVNGTSPVRMSYTIEQYDGDTDLSELFLGCRQIGLDLDFKPNQMATAKATYLGMDRTALTTGTSPWYTSPTLTSSLSLVADDSAVYQSGTAVTTFTGLSLSFQITAKGEPVIGSRVSPDVFDNDLAVSGTITGLRSDFATLTLFDAETEFDILAILKEPLAAGSPQACFAVYIPRVKIASVAAPVGGGDGAKIETRTLLIGPKTPTTGYDTSVAVFSESAA
jgi:hypothetical protein